MEPKEHKIEVSFILADDETTSEAIVKELYKYFDGNRYCMGEFEAKIDGIGVDVKTLTRNREIKMY